MTSEKPYYIIGTAGHIDHGKTSLIKALTGIETDRLKEEKERGITIDLGFAYFNGPDGRRYGIVDVPGHERFIPNMLAGAYGFDVVLMVVAADDGVKPQTIEHFEILHLLRVPRAMFVITKIDLAKPERIDDVREEIEILTHDSHLANSKIIPASNITGEGLKEVSDEISRLVSEKLPTINHPYFRFPIDRAFTITGFGTVVTGTIVSGNVNVDDELHIVPLNKTVRVRNIEVHDEKVRSAGDGQRAAINLAKIEKDEIERGMELVSSELASEIQNRYYAALEMLSHRYCNLRNFSRVRLFKGTMETMATIINLEGDYFKLKGKYITQINLQDNSLIIANERFIIRDETNKYTMGGGEFILPATIKRTKITKDEISYLSKFPLDNLASKIVTSLIFDKRVFVPVLSISKMFNLDDAEILASIGQNNDEIELLNMRGKTFASKSRLKKSKDLVSSQIGEFHGTNPELPGIDKKDLREKLHNDFITESEMEIVWELLVNEGRIKDIGEFLQIRDFKIQLKGEDADLKKKILDIYSNLSGNTPKKERLPHLLNVDEDRINRIFQGLIKSRELIQLDTGVYITAEAFLKTETKAVDAIKQKGELTVADFRDILGTNRNMAVMLLEYMDNKGITIRKGNSRILKKR